MLARDVRVAQADVARLASAEDQLVADQWDVVASPDGDEFAINFQSHGCLSRNEGCAGIGPACRLLPEVVPFSTVNHPGAGVKGISPEEVLRWAQRFPQNPTRRPGKSSGLA